MGFGKVQATFSDICVLLLTQNWKKTDPRFEVILSNLRKPIQPVVVYNLLIVSISHGTFYLVRRFNFRVC